MALRRRSGAWIVDIRITQPDTGETRRLRRSCGKGTTKKEAQKKHTLWRRELRASFQQPKLPELDPTPPPAPEPASKTFPEFAWHWYRLHTVPNCKPSTQRVVEGVLRKHAVPFFGAVPLGSVASERIAKTRRAVHERLEAEIRYWDQRAEELKAQELAGKSPRLNSGRARTRADEFEARLARRRLELDLEDDLHNSPPTIVAAAIVVPQGLVDKVEGRPVDENAAADKMETDRRAVDAVLAAERTIGRNPESQAHNNPGFDVLSKDPETGHVYFVEVKGHLPRTTEISVSNQQVQKAKANPERWRLAVVSVPDEPDADPVVRYVLEPFRDTTMHFAQTKVVLNVANLLTAAVEPC